MRRYFADGVVPPQRSWVQNSSLTQANLMNPLLQDDCNTTLCCTMLLWGFALSAHKIAVGKEEEAVE